MEDKIITEKESIELIASMIKDSRKRLEKNAGLPFLVSGYMALAVSIMAWGLIKYTGSEYWNFLWFLMIFPGFLLGRYQKRKDPKRVTSYIDKIVTYVWQTYGFLAIIIALGCFIYPTLPVLFITLNMMGMATILTGRIVKYRMTVVWGIVGVICSVGCLLTEGLDQYIPFGLDLIFLLIIPGHVMNRAARKQINS